MKIAVTAESTIDLPKSLLEEFSIRTVPFMVTMGEKMGLDGEITPEEEFAYTKETGKLPHTAAVNPFQYEEFFADVLKTADHIIHFSLSSQISKAYENACLVANDEFEGKVDVIDTLSLSTGIALQAISCRKSIDEGKSLEEVLALAKKRVPYCQASFSLESVDNLYKGGRCSKLAMLGANLLKIKPSIYVESDGKMYPGRKYRGPMEKVVGGYIDETLDRFPNPDKSLVFITYSSATPEALQVAKDKLKAVGFERIEPTAAGATVSCYCGPHCLGILYFNDGGRK